MLMGKKWHKHGKPWVKWLRRNHGDRAALHSPGRGGRMEGHLTLTEPLPYALHTPGFPAVLRGRAVAKSRACPGQG